MQFRLKIRSALTDQRAFLLARSLAAAVQGSFGDMGSYGDVVLECSTCGQQSKCHVAQHPDKWPKLTDVDGVGLLCEPCLKTPRFAMYVENRGKATITCIKSLYPCLNQGQKNGKNNVTRPTARASSSEKDTHGRNGSLRRMEKTAH